MSGTHRGPASGDDTDEGGKSTRGWPFRIFKWTLIGGLVFALLMAAGFVFVYTKTSIPDPNADFETQTTHIYYAGGKDELGSFYTHNRESISYDEMPDSIKDAVVAAENRGFWKDKGIDPRGILRAAFSNAQGNNQQGASTITQQYVKILYLTQERSYKRKIKEAFLSLKIHRQQTKERILEGYLNTIYFGRGAYGVEAAAKAYFNKKAKKLSVKESAVLASVINNPTLFDPDNREGKEPNPYLVERYKYVLRGMAEAEKITAAEQEKASARLPKIPEEVRDNRLKGQRGHMLNMVENELERLIDVGDLKASKQDIQGGGLRVTTTFTQKAMTAAERAVKEERPEGKQFDRQLHVAVASVQPGTGAVRGFYGGQDFLQSEHNWAVEGGMAGSTMKAYTLAAAIKDGFSLKDSFDGDSPYELEGSDIAFDNQGFKDYGRVNMIKAAEDSINTAFIDMIMGMEGNGPEKVVKTANAMGVPPAKAPRTHVGYPNSTRDLKPEVGVTLGTAVVSPINMANGYATLAARGKWAEPYIIEKVTDRNGEELYTHRVQDKRAVEQDIADDVSYALQQVVTAGSGKEAQNLGRPAAGKTGTATSKNPKTDKEWVSSSWFVGYTPQLSTAVMYVRGKGSGPLDNWLPEYFGGSYPARTWTNVMGKVLEGEEELPFPEPAYVDEEAPSDGHDPYVPPPPKPTKTKTKDPTKGPPSTNTPSNTPPTEPPPTEPSQTLPTFPTDSPSSEDPDPDPTPSDTECPFPPCEREPRQGGEDGQPQDQRREQFAREQYARLD